MLRGPGRTGAVAPSSAALGRMMTRDLGPETGAVVELGGGTGRITEAILARGIAPERLAVYEMNPVFAGVLRRRFPQVTVLEADARTIAETPLADVGAVVSGLPFRSLPTTLQRPILEGAFQLMRPGGVFVQFTYGWRPPIIRPVCDALELSWTASRWILGNLPPARVFWYRQGR